MLSACPASMTRSIAAVNRARACSAVSVPKHEPVGLVEELLDRGLELGLRAEVRHPVPVVLLQSVRGQHGDRERGGDGLRRLDGLGLFARPDHAGAEVAEPGRQELGPAAADLVELPGRCRLIGLYLGLRVPYEYEPTHVPSTSRLPSVACSHSSGSRL